MQRCIYMYNLVNDNSRNNVTSLYEDKTIIAITPALRKSFGPQNLLPTGVFLDLLTVFWLTGMNCRQQQKNYL